MNRKPRGYWQNWENFEQEIKIEIERLGHFPSENEMRALKKDTAIVVARNYYGGWKAVRERMGYSFDQRPTNYWQDPMNIKREFEAAVAEIGHVPTQDELNENGRSGLVGAITKYAGGMVAFKTAMGYQNGKRPHSYWKDQKNIEEEIRRFLTLHPEFKTIPSQAVLCELGFNSLSVAIVHYHGGLVELRKKLGLKSGKEKFRKGELKDIGVIIGAVQKITENEGLTICPSEYQLRSLGYTSICNAIYRYHGGFLSFRQKLNEYLGRSSENINSSLLEIYVGENNG